MRNEKVIYKKRFMEKTDLKKQDMAEIMAPFLKKKASIKDIINSLFTTNEADQSLLKNYKSDLSGKRVAYIFDTEDYDLSVDSDFSFDVGDALLKNRYDDFNFYMLDGRVGIVTKE